MEFLQRVEAEKLKDNLQDMIRDMEEDYFIAGHSNGYDDGSGPLKDIFVDGLMFDCR